MSVLSWVSGSLAVVGSVGTLIQVMVVWRRGRSALRRLKESATPITPNSEGTAS
jgi:hypothetical protein